MLLTAAISPFPRLPTTACDGAACGTGAAGVRAAGVTGANQAHTSINALTTSDSLSDGGTTYTTSAGGPTSGGSSVPRLLLLLLLLQPFLASPVPLPYTAERPIAVCATSAWLNSCCC
ncbi:hypothetical protein Vafri_8842 [Volvox africanus]|uniref:Uncharacterized protein n=1 Tax=Volvox africanus TaxID=51714 RepID=A0A8J4B7F4_9CHLO|nr:hypothetical protein Vafri_8842 [Volvox africanus]